MRKDKSHGTRLASAGFGMAESQKASLETHRVFEILVIPIIPPHVSSSSILPPIGRPMRALRDLSATCSAATRINHQNTASSKHSCVALKIGSMDTHATTHVV